MNTDGSEDAQGHCLKPEGVAAGAFPTIAAETARLNGEAREETPSLILQNLTVTNTACIG